jgi:hypothetical protein
MQSIAKDQDPVENQTLGCAKKGAIGGKEKPVHKKIENKTDQAENRCSGSARESDIGA